MTSSDRANHLSTVLVGTAEASADVPVRAPFDLVATLLPLRRGYGDPAFRVEGRVVWRTTRTPAGAASIRFAEGRERVDVDAWGPGAGWAVEHAGELLGADDDPLGFRPDVPLLRDLQRRFAGIRLGRSGAVLEALVPAILEQKVTGEQARQGYRGMLRAFGERAPGPRPLVLPPSPERLVALPYYAYHPLGI
ncbi:MAG TPA: DNA-3-methyladenine glycosylase 2 family protein, partial [Candidatus Dormibacteraeota bacterium]|nr:DNA-3-methyladenine glycosylase 2 family protein [Candidatus Dormibacteraeota bacterium]